MAPPKSNTTKKANTSKTIRKKAKDANRKAKDANRKAKDTSKKGSSRRLLFIIDKSDNPISVNIDDLMCIKGCGPKRAEYLYNQLPLVCWTTSIEDIANTPFASDTIAPGNITLELIKSHNRELREFTIEGVVAEQIANRSGDLWECREKAKQLIDNDRDLKQHLCEFYLDILRYEREAHIEFTKAIRRVFVNDDS